MHSYSLIIDYIMRLKQNLIFRVSANWQSYSVVKPSIKYVVRNYIQRPTSWIFLQPIPVLLKNIQLLQKSGWLCSFSSISAYMLTFSVWIFIKCFKTQWKDYKREIKICGWRGGEGSSELHQKSVERIEPFNMFESHGHFDKKNGYINGRLYYGLKFC